MNIVVPQLGESVVEARITKWLKKAGDRVQAGEPLVELETEKIDVEVPADRSGVLTSIAHQEGDDVKVGDVLAFVDESAPDTAPDPKPDAAAPKPETRNPTPDPAALKPETRNPEPDPARPKPETRNPEPDPARLKPETRNPEPDPARPKPDTRHPTPAPGSRSEERVRMSKRRATIARRLVEAQRTAAMLTTFNEVDMTAVMAIRARHKAAFKERFGVGLGLTSFFVKAVIAALRAFPQVNAEIQGDEIVYKRYYDIGIAVGAEGGLVVPVLRDADRMCFGDIERAVRDVAARANDGSLTLDDLTGGTFTITNGGVFGSLMSTPILNPPQVGILGLHTIMDRPVAVDGQAVIRPMMYIALSYDHRLVDGREAVQFLVTVKEFVEDPSHLLLEG